MYINNYLLRVCQFLIRAIMDLWYAKNSLFSATNYIQRLNQC